jgi:hypothetical protein
MVILKRLNILGERLAMMQEVSGFLCESWYCSSCSFVASYRVSVLRLALALQVETVKGNRAS